MLLLSPAAGVFTRALGRGAALVAGQAAGVLVRLDRAALLVVPPGANGLVANERPERVHAPVSYGELIYELAPFSGAAEIAPRAADPAARSPSGALVVRSPQSGRFYRRSAPAEPEFVRAGEILEAGRPVGLIEGMKTFAQVAYRPGGELPARARFVRYLAAHASDVREGEPLCEIEPG